MGRLSGVNAALDYAWLSLRVRIARARSGELERGASAVEWVVISMIVVGICAVVGGVLYNALNDRAGNVKDCINGTTATTTGKGC